MEGESTYQFQTQEDPNNDVYVLDILPIQAVTLVTLLSLAQHTDVQGGSGHRDHPVILIQRGSAAIESRR